MNEGLNKSQYFLLEINNSLLMRYGYVENCPEKSSKFIAISQSTYINTLLH